MRLQKSIAALLIVVLSAMIFLPSSAQPQLALAGPPNDPTVCPPSCTLYLPLVNRPDPVQISNIEFTQATQSLNNDVPLVANRPTLARITFTLNGGSSPVGGVTVQLHALRGGVELGGSPISNSTAFTASVLPNRGNLNDTLNLWLPSAWTSAPTDIYAVVVSPGNNRYPASGFVTLNFQNTPALTIMIVPINANFGGNATSPTGGPSYSYLTPFVYQTYPLSQINVSVHSAIAFNSSNYPPTSNDWINMLNTITSLHSSEDPSTPNKEYYGLVNVPCGGGCISGIGWINDPNDSKKYFTGVGFDGAGFSGNPASTTAAHEFGHNLGRTHAPNCGGSPYDSSYPNGTGKIDDWGFNIQTSALYNPASYYDFMSYCSPDWTSKYGFQALFNFRAAILATAPSALQVSQEVLAVSGWMNGAQVYVSPPFSIAAPATPDDPQGEYRLELRDGANQMLRSLRFNLKATDSSAKGFHLNVPTDARARRMQIYRGTRLVFEQRASSDLRLSINTTQLAQNDPTELSWSASGARSYMVRASNDGGQRWHVLGLNLSEQQLKLDLPSLPGGDVLVEVQASDGVQVVRHRTQTHVSKHPPHAHIAPKDVQSVKAGQPFHLFAIAYDAEDGALSGSSVRWSSDRDGVLGSGTTLWLERGLSAGTHTITLSITDSDGNISTDEFVIDAQ